jgi:LPXTG-motif cell wall-anchored protein
MLRKIAAGTSAAVVAAGLAAAPAVAAGLPASPGAALPGGDPRAPRCGDAAQTEQNAFEGPATHGFVFGPLADVPHLLSSDRSCFTVASEVADVSGARRHSASPPPVGTPVPEVPSSPPGDSGPGAPGPGDSGPASASPPADTDTPSLPASPDFTPTTAPAAVAPSPPPPRGKLGAPGESLLPSAQPPPEAAPRLPQTASDTRPLTVAGGGSLIAAGLAWIGSARRRRKRPADPAPAD